MSRAKPRGKGKKSKGVYYQINRELKRKELKKKGAQ